MRILFVNKLYAPDIAGGAELTLANLAAGMQRRGHEVLVATTTSQQVAVEEKIADVPVSRVPLRNVYWHLSDSRQSTFKRMQWHARDIHNQAMGDALGGVIRRFDPDVVAFHNIVGFSAAAWDAAFAQNKPTVQVLHDYYNLCPRSQMFRNGKNCGEPCTQCKLFRLGRANNSNRLKAVVGVSEAVLGAHLRNGLFADVAIRRIIANARPTPLHTEPRRYPPTATVFGFIGALAEWKGTRLLLETFRRLMDDPTLPPIRLVLAGDGDAAYTAELKAAYACDRIEFLGRVAPESYYERIDVNVVPSLWHDPLPSVVFESLLFGVPVIGSRRGGIPEMATDRVNGLIFDPDEPEALARCIRELATTPGLLQQFGEQAKRDSAPYASMDRVVDEHLAVCQQAAGV